MESNLAYKLSHPHPEGYFSDPYPSRGCFDTLPEETIGGVPVAMAPTTINHERIKGNIYRAFGNYLEGRICEALPDGAGVFLAEEDYYIPDVMIVCDPDKIKPDGVHGAPDLVVEVLSPGTARYDRGRKRDRYEQCGVREYWIVNPEDKSVEQYLLTGGRFALQNVYYAACPDWMLARMKEEERAAIRAEIRCSLYDDFTIPLAVVFARVP